MPCRRVHVDDVTFSAAMQARQQIFPTPRASDPNEAPLCARGGTSAVRQILIVSNDGMLQAQACDGDNWVQTFLLFAELLHRRLGTDLCRLMVLPECEQRGLRTLEVAKLQLAVEPMVLLFFPWQPRCVSLASSG